MQHLHLGAAIGFALGSLVAGRVPPKLTIQRSQQVIRYIHTIDSLLSGKVLLAVFVFGSVYLARQVLSLGAGVSMRGMRDVYLLQEFSVIAWFGGHMYMVLCALIAFGGLQDGISGFRGKWLATRIAVCAPLGLGFAGRIFLLQLTMIYLATFVLSRGQAPRVERPRLRNEVRQLLVIAVVCIGVFALIGHIRERPMETLDSFNPAAEILGWPASSVAALHSWLGIAETLPRGNGALTSDWVGRNLERLGLVDFSEFRARLSEAVRVMTARADGAGSVPMTLIPQLVIDFGKDSIVPGMAAIALVLQIVSVRLRGRGLFGDVAAAMAVLGAFTTIQGTVLRTDLILTVLWAGVLVILFTRSGRSLPVRKGGGVGYGHQGLVVRRSGYSVGLHGSGSL